MPWSNKILRQFQGIPETAMENEFHGPYNKLLNILFPPDSDFTVAPQFLQSGSSKASDFIVTYEILLRKKPLLIIELKAPSALGLKSTRAEADDRIRGRLGDLSEQCPIPKLHAISAMGTKLCFYSLDLNDQNSLIVPHHIPRHPDHTNDVAPREWWDCDLLEDAGETRLRAVVDEIKTECARLDD